MKINPIYLFVAMLFPLSLGACAVEPTGYYGSEYPDGGGASVSHVEPTTTTVYEPSGDVVVTPGATYYDSYWHGGHYGRR